MSTLEIRFAVLALSLGAACAAGPQANRAPRVDSSTITEEQLAKRNYQNLYEAVHALRSNWLSTRGADSFRAPSQVMVYVDHQRFGGVESLASMATQGIASIRRINGIDATARYGLGHSAGVIFVQTWRNRDRDSVGTSPGAADSASKRPVP